jgi:sulfate permease, SulP family
VAAFDLQRPGIGVVGPVPRGPPVPAVPGLAELPHLLLPAVGVLVVGYTDTILTARSFAGRDGGGTGNNVDNNQELLALGTTNLGAGVLHGFPVSSSGSRTALGVLAGSRTQLYSLVALGTVVVVLLAGAALVGVLVFDILYGVLLAVALSVAEMLHRIARPHDAIQGLVPDLAGMHDVDDYPEAKTIPGLVVYRYDSRRAARPGRLVRPQRRGQRRGGHHRA